MFFTALKNTAVYTLGSVLIQMPLALMLALALNRPDIRGRAWFRLIFFAPSLVGVVFVAMMFALLFEKRTGMLNVLLHAITKHTPAPWNLDFPWLENFVMSALIVASLWQWVGFNMVYFLAALQNVPKDQIEAATVDGAGPIARFLAVTWPRSGLSRGLWCCSRSWARSSCSNCRTSCSTPRRGLRIGA